MIHQKQLTYNQSIIRENKVKIGNWFEEQVLQHVPHNDTTFGRVMIQDSEKVLITEQREYGKEKV